MEEDVGPNEDSTEDMPTMPTKLTDDMMVDEKQQMQVIVRFNLVAKGHISHY